MLSKQRRPMLIPFVLTIVLVGAPLGVAATNTPEAETHFDVEIIETDSSVVAGEPLTVTAVITNTGSARDSQQIHLKGGNATIVDSVAGPPLTLDPGENQTVSLTWNTTSGDVGAANISVQSNTAYPTADVTITPAPALTSELGGVASEVTVGDTLAVPVTVTNTGNASATPMVWMALNGSQIANRRSNVAPAATEQVTFNYTPTESDLGSWNLTAGIDSDNDATMVTVISQEPTADRNPAESSSGGSSPNTLDRQHATLDSSGMATFTGGDVRQVRFAEPVAGTVIATRIRAFQAGVSEPPSTIERYNIEPPAEATESNATIRFELSATSVETESNETVRVTRWNGTNWTTLPTETTQQGDQIVVDATTTQFSLFAVTTGDSPAAPPTTESVSATTATDETDKTSTSVKSDSIPAGIGVLIAGLAAILLGAGYIGRQVR